MSSSSSTVFPVSYPYRAVCLFSLSSPPTSAHLSFRRDDVLQVIAAGPNDEYVTATKVTLQEQSQQTQTGTGMTGIVPKNRIKPIADSETKTTTLNQPLPLPPPPRPPPPPPSSSSSSALPLPPPPPPSSSSPSSSSSSSSSSLSLSSLSLSPSSSTAAASSPSSSSTSVPFEVTELPKIPPLLTSPAIPSSFLPPSGAYSYSSSMSSSFDLSSMTKTVVYKYTVKPKNAPEYVKEVKNVTPLKQLPQHLSAPSLPSSLSRFLSSRLSPSSASLNSGIVSFCFSHFGHRVGDGQCYALASESLKAVGARIIKPYVFGELVATHSEGWERVNPGDIVQFEWAKFQGKADGGGTYNAFCGDQSSKGMHTAIVIAVYDSGRHFDCFEQNVNGLQLLTYERPYRLQDMTEGKCTFYRPTK